MRRVLFVFTLLILFALAHSALAQSAAPDSFLLLEPFGGRQSVQSFPDYINLLIPFVISGIAVLAVIQIIIGGLQYTLSGGKETVMRDARERIQNAIVGLLIALSIFVVIRTINPQLLDLSLITERIILTPPKPTFPHELPKGKTVYMLVELNDRGEFDRFIPGNFETQSACDTYRAQEFGTGSPKHKCVGYTSGFLPGPDRTQETEETSSP